VIRRIYIEASCLTASFETLKPAAGA